MTIYELIKSNEYILRQLCDAHVEASTVKYLELYREYKQQEKDGVKRAFTLSYLADKYKVQERHIYRIVAKFEQTVLF
jgi:hypothetical protein